MFMVNNRNSRKKVLTVKNFTPFLVFILLTLNREIFARNSFR